jgi:hypothetical protein
MGYFRGVFPIRENVGCLCGRVGVSSRAALEGAQDGHRGLLGRAGVGPVRNVVPGRSGPVVACCREFRVAFVKGCRLIVPDMLRTLVGSAWSAERTEVRPELTIRLN